VVDLQSLMAKQTSSYRRMDFDLDDGVKANNPKFRGAIAEVKGLTRKFPQKGS
jgi:hypothetical protein